MKVLKKQNENFFMVCDDNFAHHKSWKEANALQSKGILHDVAECDFEGNIPSRWEIFSLDDDMLSEQDRGGLYYAYDTLAKSVFEELKQQNLSVYALSKKTNIQEIQLHRFFKAENDLSLNYFIKMMNALGKGFKFGELI